MFKPVFILDNNVNWFYLSENPNAINILEQNLNKVKWLYLAKNPNAIHILEQNLDKVNWFWLSENPNAISLLAPLNTEKMRENCKAFAEELAVYVFHPIRLMRICQAHGLELEEYFECV